MHEGGLTHTLQSEQGINAYNRNYIYNPEVGWRERTATEKISKTMDVYLGPPLKVIGDGTVSVAPGTVSVASKVVKYGLYLGAGLGLAWAASSVAIAAYDGVERLVT